MYLLYIDESGDPNGWERHNHFVLGGVAIHEGQVYGLAKQLDQIQSAFFPGVSIPMAFHATDIRGGKNQFGQLQPQDRERLLAEVGQVLSESRFPNLIAFATISHISVVQTPRQVLRDTFQDICQRFNTFLVRQFNRGYKDKGLLIIDQAHEQRYRELVAEFRVAGTDYGYLGNIVDIPYFAGRRDTRMIQLADFVAYAVFRRYEASDTSYFDRVLPRFDRRVRDHPPDGLKHFTHDACQCEACSWR